MIWLTLLVTVNIYENGWIASSKCMITWKCDWIPFKSGRHLIPSGSKLLSVNF